MLKVAASLILAAMSVDAVAADSPQQATDTAGANAASSGELEEIIVSSQKVRENLQNSAIAVATISGDALNEANIASPKDLNATAPGLVANSTPSNPLALSIRGAGYQGIENNSAQPGVGYNQNGVYISSPVALNSNFLDVAQIEVLRGPQGTVLGQNSDGGAINVTTVRPEPGVLDGNAEVSGANYDYDRVRLALNAPVGDQAAVRFAFQQERHDGYTTAESPDHSSYQLGNEDSYNGRADGLWKPSERLSVEVWGEFYTNSSNGEAFKNIYDPNPNPYLVSQDFPGRIDAQSAIVAANVVYHLDWAIATAIASYQHGKLDAPEDLDKLDFATGIQVFGVHDIDEINSREGYSTTQELHLASIPGGKFDWIGGVFFIEQIYHETVLEYQYTHAGEFLPASVANPGAVFATNALAFESVDTQKLNSYSAYGQGTYHFTDRLSFIGGVRATDDSQAGLVSVFFNPAVSLPTGFKTFTGKTELQYQLAPASMVYGMWSSGVKPGGTNLNPGSTVIPTVFLPERNNAFELGSKNEFLNQTLRLNLAAFYNFFTHYQVDSEDPVPFKGGQTNVDKVDTYGLETEFTSLLPYEFRIDANMTLMGGRVDSHQQLLDPEIAQQINRVDGGPFVGTDLADRFAAFYAPSGDIYGKTPPEVPNFAANVNLSQAMHWADGSVLTTHLKYSFRNSYYFRIFNNPATDEVPVLRQWDVDFNYVFPTKKLRVDFLVENLGNTASVLSRYTDNFGVGAVSNFYVPPRLYVGRVGYSF